MAVLVTKSAPDFKAKAVLKDGTFADLTLSQFKGKYVLLFFYPFDFTFVCLSEIIAFSDRVKEFTELNVEVIGVSVDSEYSHSAWRNVPRAQGGIGQIDYPLVSDLNKRISRDYDVLFDDSVAIRGLFLIDIAGVVRHQVVNDFLLGRSVDEALRMVQALQFVEKNGEVCPANSQEGKLSAGNLSPDYLLAEGR